VEERVPILEVDGNPAGWTMDARQYALLPAHVLDGSTRSPDGTVLLKYVVAEVQEHFGSHQGG